MKTAALITHSHPPAATEAVPIVAAAAREAGWRLIATEEEIARIQALAIPPAYADVWICPDPRGHIQATGRDARGRKQYRYHALWREVRDATIVFIVCDRGDRYLSTGLFNG